MIGASEHVKTMNLAARIGAQAGARPRMCMRCWQKGRRTTPAAREIDGFDYCLPCAAEEDYSPADGTPILGPVLESSPPRVKAAPKSPPTFPPHFPQVSPAADLTPDAVFGSSASPLPRVAGAAAAEESPKKNQEEPMKTKNADLCANPECGKPLPADRPKHKKTCNKACAQRTCYLRDHPQAKRRGAKAAPSNIFVGANGHDKESSHLDVINDNNNGHVDARTHMRIAASGNGKTTEQMAAAIARQTGNGAGTMRISREHLNAWWTGLSDEGAFDLFVRIMFPGVGHYVLCTEEAEDKAASA